LSQELTGSQGLVPTSASQAENDTLSLGTQDDTCCVSLSTLIDEFIATHIVSAAAPLSNTQVERVKWTLRVIIPLATHLLAGLDLSTSSSSSCSWRRLTFREREQREHNVPPFVDELRQILLRTLKNEIMRRKEDVLSSAERNSLATSFEVPSSSSSSPQPQSTTTTTPTSLMSAVPHIRSLRLVMNTTSPSSSCGTAPHRTQTKIRKRRRVTAATTIDSDSESISDSDSDTDYSCPLSTPQRHKRRLTSRVASSSAPSGTMSPQPKTTVITGTTAPRSTAVKTESKNETVQSTDDKKSSLFPNTTPSDSNNDNLKSVMTCLSAIEERQRAIQQQLNALLDVMKDFTSKSSSTSTTDLSLLVTPTTSSTFPGRVHASSATLISINKSKYASSALSKRTTKTRKITDKK
jgi:hypothetical protein